MFTYISMQVCAPIMFVYPTEWYIKASLRDITRSFDHRICEQLSHAVKPCNLYDWVSILVGRLLYLILYSPVLVNPVPHFDRITMSCFSHTHTIV